ncbi:polysaccharide biosynthesis tyrosine autokinase [Streptococcus pantholopis]|uniref:Tyrosine-protein kinase CpsD n=1 Tax=Streptococcus pantholopis TaxID=1811193 RepID=A0A172Q7S1_9STRE|nr:polysaccharide biosynthesis tyrosine autokinase [Streptococcus pantholopis]AND79467.1 tyrosine protein kinase [Streptococcus pantholopis]
MAQLELVKSQAKAVQLTKDYYNRVRKAVQFKGRNCKTIVVTSVSPGEGKTTVSLNLALSFARAGFQTLLLDADAGNSAFSNFFSSPAEDNKGLVDFFAGKSELSDIICETDAEHLVVLPAGSSNADQADLDLLQSADFSQLIEAVSDLYDYVIIDTPSIGLGLDAAVVAQNADASILVAEAGSTKRRFLIKAKNQLQQSGSAFLGVVLNRAEIDSDSYGPYGAYGKPIKKQPAKKGKK